MAISYRFLHRGTWSKESTWQTFYNKEVISQEQVYQEKAFSSQRKD